MNFEYNKAICQNLRESLRLEWLETNGLGDYASSSIVSCNTRRYHGLFVANLDRPAGRHVLLSALEESLLLGGHEFFFSCRQHPGNFFPKGHEYLREAEIGAWPLFRYRIGDVVLTREIVMPHGEHRVLIRYSLEGGAAQAKLRIKPLLAYRNFHALTHANMNLHVRTWPETAGFKVEPYDGMPPLFMQTDGRFTFLPSPDWYYNAEYLIERERGFPYAEDLFQPGLFEIELAPQRPVILSAALQPTGKAARLARLWNDETQRRLRRSDDESLTAHLEREGEKFLIDSPRNGKIVIAGYPWFDAWGRDTFIALPGLTFCAGRSQEGVDILAGAGRAIKNGLIPNCYGADGVHHSYNSADASLWYVWAVQQMTEQASNGLQLVKNLCWQPVKEIIAAYADGRAPHTRMDESGLLHVGAPDTQLTWMDASVGGRPVTPRWGCPVEINALWYNALVFAGKTAAALGETPPWDKKRLAALKKEFQRRFWSEERGYLADVWRADGADWSFRPNQLFAASLPEPVLDRPLAAEMLARVRTLLLTPYGLRTLSPADANYRSLYEGSPEERDSAYHQGTVWPWLLGAYGDTLLFALWDRPAAARHLLGTITPLCTAHLREYGVGSVAEIFDAAPPYRPNGAVAQAWSVAELLRVLKKMRRAAPGVYRRWEAHLREETM
ncbi:glycogen debranching protein [Pyramidobacter sp. SM-530-WT-4B]|uniref:Glycogen debranching protein n=2 Tax=Pyramidobacter porci TaxID=2605789 RepID=A0A6L5YBF2_9BACT|nr:amylo-alpha-1,6-glucosidase [Pyramidobacter porci]MST55551.1 glycogen debranching protein [Pyramidobacter porci]